MGRADRGAKVFREPSPIATDSLASEADACCRGCLADGAVVTSGNRTVGCGSMGRSADNSGEGCSSSSGS